MWIERSSLFAQRPQAVSLRFHPLLTSNRECLPRSYTLDLQGWYPDYLTYDILKVFTPSQIRVRCLCLVREVSPQINYLRWRFQSLTHFRDCQFLRVTLPPMIILYSSTRPPSSNLWADHVTHWTLASGMSDTLLVPHPELISTHSFGPRDL